MEICMERWEFYQLINRKHLSEHTCPSLGFAGFVLKLWNYQAANNKYSALILIICFKITVFSRLWFLEFSTGLLHIIFFPFHTHSSAQYPTDNSDSQEPVNGMNSSHNIPLTYSCQPGLFPTETEQHQLRAKFPILLSAWKLLLMSFF